VAQCVSNLLHNAFKFTAGGQVALRVALHGDSVTITVADTGRGISAEMLPRLFELFSQEGASGREGNSGLGIGLALTQYLVAQHGGTLTAHSDGPGLGARFEISLPVAAATAAPAPAAQPAPAAAPASDAMAILVVDDNVDAAETLQALLALHGFEAGVAHTGAAAITLLAQRRYAAVLLDIGLPDMSGYEVAGAMRRHGAGRPRPASATT
jgi:hypothetical protein